MKKTALDAIAIRPATPDDAMAIAELKVITWRDSYAGLMPDSALASLDARAEAPHWRDWLEDTTSGLIALVLEEAGHLIGYGLAGPMRKGDREGSEIDADAEIYAIYIHPERQRAGFGKQLFAGLAERLIDAGYAMAGLWMVGGNDKAENFYQAIGGEEQGKRVEIVNGRIAFREKGWLWRDLRQLRTRLTLKSIA
ncbi:GNAT family N-acetyltransferase [Cohaesibacter sp. CAU 1516]|uniref:GNAT family N-acetyltransferase n=1 Tax=Cohaesibacter sp. CAU 1516 TaxID=2576038 RepID=UPI0010FDABAC|nr:GNAT family N-acetyltransferase [Cohaesibacter sp. CAU 1516]TLP45627.1 GNAT family N-acetyltransferase [Cohaesibacter sp. CAU 1516]